MTTPMIEMAASPPLDRFDWPGIHAFAGSPMANPGTIPLWFPRPACAHWRALFFRLPVARCLLLTMVIYFVIAAGWWWRTRL